MKYATENRSGAKILVYIKSFIKMGSGIQNLMEGEGDIQTAWYPQQPFKIRKVG
jgi:hypothetical protein